MPNPDNRSAGESLSAPRRGRVNGTATRVGLEPSTPTSIERICGGCGERISSTPIARGKSFEVKIAGRVFAQPEWRLYECTRCGLVSRTPTLSEADFAAYYANKSAQTWEYPKYQPPERILIKELEKLPPDAAVLDFGCSTGRLLAPFVGRLRCFGIEINQAAAEIAGRRGIRLSAIEEVEPETLDAVILSDVFEHLEHPTELLRLFVRWLKPAGRVLLASGDGDAHAFRRSPDDWWYFRTVEHVCMWTEQYARHLAQYGLSVGRTWRVCHVRFAERILWWRRGFIWKTRTYFARWGMTAPLCRVPVVRSARRWGDPPLDLSHRDHLVVDLIKR